MRLVGRDGKDGLFRPKKGGFLFLPEQIDGIIEALTKVQKRLSNSPVSKRRMAKDGDTLSATRKKAGTTNEHAHNEAGKRTKRARLTEMSNDDTDHFSEKKKRKTKMTNKFFILFET